MAGAGMPSLRVLVVDDNDLIRRLVGLILEGAGHVAVQAESGEVALEVAHRDPPDVCVVDEVMPGMKGSELIRALRRSPDLRLRAVPVIGISGRAGAGRELLEAGANAFVPKPVEEGALLSTIERLAPPSQRGHGSASGLPA
jgi:CheY-like chemotaxis protein